MEFHILSQKLVSNCPGNSVVSNRTICDQTVIVVMQYGYDVYIQVFVSEGLGIFPFLRQLNQYFLFFLLITLLWLNEGTRGNKSMPTTKM